MWEEISAHVYKHMKIMSKRPGELAWIIVYPFVSVLSIGILAFFLITKGAPTDSIMFVFVGIVIWNLYTISQRGITYGITFDVWSNSLKHAFIARSSAFHFIAGNAMFGLLSSLATVVLVGIVGMLVFGFNIFAAGLFLVNLLFIFLFATAIGLLVNGLMLTKGEKYMSLIWMGPGIVMIFSGIYYPISILPDAMQAVSNVIPLTHLLTSLRASFGFSPGLAVPSLVTGALLALAYLAVGALVFRASLQRGRMSGVITKY